MYKKKVKLLTLKMVKLLSLEEKRKQNKKLVKMKIQLK